jgi:hypothetical protein
MNFQFDHGTFRKLDKSIDLWEDNTHIAFVHNDSGSYVYQNVENQMRYTFGKKREYITTINRQVVSISKKQVLARYSDNELSTEIMVPPGLICKYARPIITKI